MQPRRRKALTIFYRIQKGGNEGIYPYVYKNDSLGVYIPQQYLNKLLITDWQYWSRRISPHHQGVAIIGNGIPT